MSLRNNYQATIRTCWLSSILQPLAVVYHPLLFLRFQAEMGLGLRQLSFLVALNFTTQMAADLSATRYADKVGIRRCLVASQTLEGVGLIATAFLPCIMPPFLGLCLATLLFSFGSGLTEVLTSPTVEACPTKNKVKSMALLHSMYSLGSIGVIMLSTLFFTTAGLRHWRILTILWAVAPLYNAWRFSVVPIPRLLEKEDEKGLSIGALAKMPLFWIIMVLMATSGAIELALSQWSSALAEASLKVTKTLGDLAGPCAFAALMLLGRLLLAHFAPERDRLWKAMFGSALLALAGFLLILLAPHPVLALSGVAVSGLAVAILWPATLSLAAKTIPRGGTPLFGLCALGGDVGSTSGPAIVGCLAASCENNLRAGMAAGIAYAAILIIALLLLRKLSARHPSQRTATH